MMSFTKLFRRTDDERTALVRQYKAECGNIEKIKTAPRNKSDQIKLLNDAIDQQAELWLAEARKYFSQQLQAPERDGRKDWMKYQFLSLAGNLVRPGTVAPGAICFLFGDLVKDRLQALIETGADAGPDLDEREGIIRVMEGNREEIRRKLEGIDAEAAEVGINFTEQWR